MILRGDCLEKLKDLADASVDSIVTDPPYGLNFMGKKWDYDVPSVAIWKEVLRVLKPGGHALIACGTRTQHRMVLNIEDAGFEIRDVVTWIYGSGFPKSLDVSKAIDKAAGAEREIVEKRSGAKPGTHGGSGQYGHGEDRSITAPSTPAAKQWSGWGTALKPACEFWTLARKPLGKKTENFNHSEKLQPTLRNATNTVAENVLQYGTGALNIDASRIETSDNLNGGAYSEGREARAMAPSGAGMRETRVTQGYRQPQGRWPANLILDEAAAAMLDEQSGIEAARFFYCAKASKSERNAGLEGMPEKIATQRMNASALRYEEGREPTPRAEQSKNQNFHPTVKPIKLMEYLIRLITPPNGTVLDPFTGSGSTGVAAKRLGFKFIGVELSDEYAEIAERRIGAA